jgi:hypothetical protein
MRAPPLIACKVKKFVFSDHSLIRYIIIIIIIVLYLCQILPVNLQLTVPEKYLLISSIVITKH